MGKGQRTLICGILGKSDIRIKKFDDQLLSFSLIERLSSKLFAGLLMSVLFSKIAVLFPSIPSNSWIVSVSLGYMSVVFCANILPKLKLASIAAKVKTATMIVLFFNG